MLKLNDSIERILVISDVHSFLEPLKEFERYVAKLPGRSQVVVGGDLFLGGTKPLETLDWVRKNSGEFVVMGNHDENVLKKIPPGDYPVYTEEGAAQRLSAAQKNYLKQFPAKLEVKWREKTIRFLHGHRDLNGKIVGADSWQSKPAELLARYGDPKIALTVLGHTHFSFVRQEGNILLADSGSACLTINAVRKKKGEIISQDDADRPLSSDIRSSFLSITERQGKLLVEIIRFDYNRQTALEELIQAGLPAHKIEHLKEWLSQGIYQLF